MPYRDGKSGSVAAQMDAISMHSIHEMKICEIDAHVAIDTRKCNCYSQTKLIAFLYTDDDANFSNYFVSLVFRIHFIAFPYGRFSLLSSEAQTILTELNFTIRIPILSIRNFWTHGSSNGK